jgi:hypothetical protein
MSFNRVVELEITPEPDEDERRAIIAALAQEAQGRGPYGSTWRRDSIAEAIEPTEAS